jgi:hypothetical protein
VQCPSFIHATFIPSLTLLFNFDFLVEMLPSGTFMRFVVRLSALIASLGLILSGLCGCAPSGGDDAGTIHVFAPLDAAPGEADAAIELARVLSIMTGRPVDVLREPYLYTRPGIYVGDTLLARKLLPDVVTPEPPTDRRTPRAAFDPRPPRQSPPLAPQRWDNAGWTSKDGCIVIAGSDKVATLLAVCAFLQKECGVRWWIPGPLGEDIPHRSFATIRDVPKTLVSPSYYSRGMYGTRGMSGELWGTHNLLRNHLSMSHALPRFLDRDCARTHPDWFPSFDGKPFDPGAWKGHLPHPVFTKPELAEYIAGKADEFFNANPGTPSFSISPDDTSLYGDLDAYAGLVDPKATFRDKANLSNAVFTYYNAVARRVTQKHPNRLLGALAYSFYENVPDFPVESNIVPFLTADRSQWYDGQFRDGDLALVRKWAAAGPKLIATWDYYYGFPFLIPRVMTREVRDSISALHEAGVRAFFCELNPIWGFDAPKAWMASRLLWDSAADPAALEREFFDGYFGPASAPMRRFYDECDAVWMKQKGPARWIKFYADADQATLFAPDKIRELRAILDEALNSDLPDRFRARVELVSGAFTYTERLCAAYPAWDAVARWTPDQPLDRLQAAIPEYLAARADMKAINSDCVGSGLNDMPNALGFLTDDDPLEGRLALARAMADRDARNHLATAAPDCADLLFLRSIPLIRNPFADGLDNWFVTHWPDPAMEYGIVGQPDDARLRVAKANSFNAQIRLRIRPGATYAASLRADGRVSPSSSVRLLLEYLDKDDTMLAFHSDRLPCGELKRALLAVAGRAPGDAITARLTIIVTGQLPGDEITLGSL